MVFKIQFENGGQWYALKEVEISNLDSEKVADSKANMLEKEFKNTKNCRHPAVISVFFFNKMMTAASK